MSALSVQSRPRLRPSVSRRDLIPELGIAAGAVAVTTVVHWVIVLRLGENPLFLFAATAAALTFWRGLGPGMLASSLGSAVGSSLYAVPINAVVRNRGNVPLETLLLFAGSMFICWLIYRLRVEQEDARALEAQRNDALAFVAHELRQPLSNIMLAAGLLDKDPCQETRGRLTTQILRSATRLGTVVDDLADVTKFQGGALKVEPTAVRLQDVLLAATEAARPAIEQKQQRLEIEVAADPPLWISADATRLEQVFGNLLSNACKYSPNKAEISISSRAEQGRAVVVVRDTGVGIRRDMLETIFEPFIRDSTGSAEGLGIGLTLARHLITQHGGRITAHSDGPGRGSAFVIELPLMPMSSEAEEASR
jgi:signal transduction histidine kinase